MTNLLNRQQCQALRGIAIIGIFLHNYCHWLKGIVRENEYQFHLQNVTGLDGVVSSPDWNLPLHLLSFFGHYGVPLFLFLSAYGLVLKYETGPGGSSLILSEGGRWAPLRGSGRFVRYHFLKLFKMMIVGYVAFTMIDFITPRHHHYQLLDVVSQLLMFNNVLPNPDRIIWPGPYWFFGLMLQLYIVYRLLLYRRHWAVTVALMTVCTFLPLLMSPEGEPLNRYRYNFMGGMLPFGLGLLCARFPMNLNKTYCCLFALVSAVLVYSLGHHYFGWLTVPLFVCSLGFAVVKVLPQWLMRPLQWMGGISAALFVCHPITRKIFIPLSLGGDVYAGLLLYVVSSICIAWLFSELLKRIPNPKY